MTVEITEGERQVILLALAELALSRPGWNPMLFELAASFAGADMFAEFKRMNNDRVNGRSRAAGAS
jgi:hypothetical protein